MKIRLVVPLVGLAINFAVPTFAQEKETVDPQIAEQIRALSIKYDDAFNKNDAAALATLYTEDAVEVTDTGPIYSREAIEKYFADVFKQVHVSNGLSAAELVRTRWQIIPLIKRSASNAKPRRSSHPRGR
jgi:hypothetical protein